VRFRGFPRSFRREVKPMTCSSRVTFAPKATRFWWLTGMMWTSQLVLKVFHVATCTENYHKQIIKHDGLPCPFLHVSWKFIAPWVFVSIFVVEQLVEIPYDPAPDGVPRTTVALGTAGLWPGSQKQICIHCVAFFENSSKRYSKQRVVQRKRCSISM